MPYLRFLILGLCLEFLRSYSLVAVGGMVDALFGFATGTPYLQIDYSLGHWIVAQGIVYSLVMPFLFRWGIGVRYPGFKVVVRRPGALEIAERAKYVETIQMSFVSAVIVLLLEALTRLVRWEEMSAVVNASIWLLLVRPASAWAIVKMPYLGFRLDMVGAHQVLER